MNAPAGTLEVIFVVEEAPEGGFTAHALGESIFTEADDLAGEHHVTVPRHDALRVGTLAGLSVGGC